MSREVGVQQQLMESRSGVPRVVVIGNGGAGTQFTAGLITAAKKKNKVFLHHCLQYISTRYCYTRRYLLK